MGEETLLILGMLKDCQERQYSRKRLRNGQVKDDNGKNDVVSITESLVDHSGTLNIILSEMGFTKGILGTSYGSHVLRITQTYRVCKAFKKFLFGYRI